MNIFKANPASTEKYIELNDLKNIGVGKTFLHIFFVLYTKLHEYVFGLRHHNQNVKKFCKMLNNCIFVHNAMCYHNCIFAHNA